MLSCQLESHRLYYIESLDYYRLTNPTTEFKNQRNGRVQVVQYRYKNIGYHGMKVSALQDLRTGTRGC